LSTYFTINSTKGGNFLKTINRLDNRLYNIPPSCLLSGAQ
jgi:hypothetical protein